MTALRHYQVVSIYSKGENAPGNRSEFMVSCNHMPDQPVLGSKQMDHCEYRADFQHH